MNPVTGSACSDARAEWAESLPNKVVPQEIFSCPLRLQGTGVFLLQKILLQPLCICDFPGNFRRDRYFPGKAVMKFKF